MMNFCRRRTGGGNGVLIVLLCILISRCLSVGALNHLPIPDEKFNQIVSQSVPRAISSAGNVTGSAGIGGSDFIVVFEHALMKLSDGTWTRLDSKLNISVGPSTKIVTCSGALNSCIIACESMLWSCSILSEGTGCDTLKHDLGRSCMRSSSSSERGS